MDLQDFPEIKPFIKKLEKFKPELILLFGSRATKNEWKRSDYDFIIVSKKFKNVHWLDRISKIVALWDLDKDIDILPYTPEEFLDKKENSSTVRSAMKNYVSLC